LTEQGYTYDILEAGALIHGTAATQA
jgi:hypothetical protein